MAGQGLIVPTAELEIGDCKTLNRQGAKVAKNTI